MKHFILLILCVNSWISDVYAQQKASIWVVDFVKIKANQSTETLYFYENNWKKYREIALEKGFIKSYQLLAAPPDSLANFDILLMTEYQDSLQYQRAEKRFQEIIKAHSPNGAKLLNQSKPADFKQNVSLKIFQTQFFGYNKKRKK
jgi:hypothetical protein